MELPLECKENMSGTGVHYASYFTTYPSTSQSQPSNFPNKRSKLKSKSQKGFPASVRAGDWICLVCNNLNFSFRNECNRCQMQTREQNQIQSLYFSDNQNFSDNPQNRAPFQDLTNQKYSQDEFDSLGLYNPIDSSPDSNSSLETIQRLPTTTTNTMAAVKSTPKKNKSSFFDYNLCQGFENMLLVTPPKRSDKTISYKEYSDSSQKELPPYKSPKYLPSISPILKRVSLKQESREISKRGERLHKYFTFAKEESEKGETLTVGNSNQLIDSSNFFYFPNSIENYKMTEAFGRQKEKQNLY